MAVATLSANIHPERDDKSPQRLIGLGSWTPSLTIEEQKESRFPWSLVSGLNADDTSELGRRPAWERILRDDNKGRSAAESEYDTDKDSPVSDEKVIEGIGNTDNDNTQQYEDSNDTDNSDIDDIDSDIDIESESLSPNYNTPVNDPRIEHKDEEQGDNRETTSDYADSKDSAHPFDTEPAWEFLRHLTISRDQTHASSFEREKLAALLGEQDLDVVDDPGEHKEQTSQPPFTLSSSLQALEDYNRELDLLKMQDMNRLTMTGQDQDALVNNIAGGGSSQKRTTLTTAVVDMDQTVVNGKYPASSEAPENHVQIAQLQQEIERLRKIQSTLTSTTWLVLHMIQGDGTTYLAEPSWAPKQGQSPCFRGNSPLANESQYLKHRPDAAFVVYKHYDPSFQAKDIRKAIEEGSAMPFPKPAREVVQPLSEQMVAALDAFVILHPTFGDKFPGWKSSDPINSPFLFWYCYRDSTNLQDMDEQHKKQMLLLTQWIDDNYSEMHAGAEAKFAAGYVCESTMPFFIRPGEVLVSKDDKGVHGHIADSWLRASHPNDRRKISPQWSIDCWSYGYDGKFYRETTVLTVVSEFDDDNPDVSISKLNVLPLRFGDDEFRSKLDRRGRVMWACRKRNLISYKDINENDFPSVSFKTCHSCK